MSGRLQQSRFWSDLGWDACGQASFSGELLRLQQELDSVFLKWAKTLGAGEYSFPTFIEAAQLQKIGYFKSFPHLVTFPVTLDCDQANLDDFARSACPDENGNLALTITDPVSQVLTPAACYHFYKHLQDTTIHSPLFLTTQARCFRRERCYLPLRRQWNFSMRELVCIGSAVEVEKHLSLSHLQLQSIFDQIGLPVRFEQATDPFFDPCQSPGYLMQRLAPLKTEALYGDLAIASLNFHHDHFGRAFGIRRTDAPAFSGCVAFGLERWLFALIDHFGDRALEIVANLRVPQLESVQ